MSTASTSPVTADAIAAQLGEELHRFDAEERSLHVDLIQSIQKPKEVALNAKRSGARLWTVTVSTSDCIGTLSAISGLFAVHAINIQSVDVFTLDFSEAFKQVNANRTQPLRGYLRRSNRRARSIQPSQPARRILDIFKVRSQRDIDSDFWTHFKLHLEELISFLVDGQQSKAQEKIIDSFADAFNNVEAESRLFEVDIDIDNDASPNFTKLTISSEDTPGFLFAYTNALTSLGVNIEKAEIQTTGGRVRDTFWLTESSGSKIVSEKRVHDLRTATVLIKQFTYLLPKSSNPSQSLRQFNAMMRQILANPDWTDDLRDLGSPGVLELLADVMGVSQFLWEDFLRMQHENLFPVLIDTPSLNERKPSERLHAELREHLRNCRTHEECVIALNRFKDREMFRIDLRHIGGKIDFRSFAHELSDLSEVVVQEAAALSYVEVERRLGSPTLDHGKMCAWSVFGLGKFGGRELGYGSDIELIFVYEGEGVTEGPNPAENSLFFGELVRTFHSAIKAKREGIFEIDLRLRPHGNKGPMATSIDEFQRYYSHDGPSQQFERLALVKLRFVAGDADLGERVVEARDEFVYSSEPLDIDNISHLRNRQADELVTKGPVNAKYSSGGLVDIEYFVQASQIMAGYSNPSLRVTNTIEAMSVLFGIGWLDQELCDGLIETYSFMRRLIDGLRVVRGHAKDLTIPPSDSREFAYLTQRLQFDSTAQLEDEISRKMQFAASIWNQGLLQTES